MKTKYERTGFGPLGWVCLVALFYVIVSASVAFATRDASCAIGYQREWRYAPPGWVCHR